MNEHNKHIIGSSQTLTDTLDHTSILAAINRPVLICGERGSGKELIASRLHYLSARWDQAFITLNCAAISDELMDSELFGHEAGAFTGATKSYTGRFERAHEGTLFLDELGTMSLRIQEKLLRLIEYGEYERLGSGKTRYTDVRIIAATNADLLALSQSGRFRADLLDRLAFDVIRVPPLRERKDDIAELAESFGIKLSIELGWDYFPGFSTSALAELMSYDWPGNIRELKNVVERSIYRSGNQDTPIQEMIINPFAVHSNTNNERNDNNPTLQMTPPLTSLNTAPTPSKTPNQLPANRGLKEATAAFQKQRIQEALTAHQHNQKLAAEALKLTYDQFRGLYRKLF